MKKVVAAMLNLLLLAGWAGPAISVPATVGPGTITFIENGWYGEGFAIHLSAGISGCPAPSTEFAIPASHPGYKEVVMLMTSAYFTGSTVSLVVDQGVCSLGQRTKVISIRLPQ